jgi:hypothetical protein
MKLNHLLSESDLNEFDVPFIGKKAKAQRASDKATKQSMRDELMNMEVELKTFMRTAKIKTATPEIILGYLKQKGLGNAGQEVINNFMTTGQKFQQAAGAAGQAVGKGIAKASAAGQAVKDIAAKLKPNDQPTATKIEPPVSRAEPSASQDDDAETSQTTKIDPLDRASKYTPRFNEQIAMDTVLSKGQVRDILQQALTKGYTQTAGFGKSKFAADEPDAAQGVSAEVKSAMDTLRKAGFKVSK